MMRLGEQPAFLRVLAFAVDWVVIAAWGGLLFGLALLFSDGEPKRLSTPWLSQGVGFMTMTLPVTLYFSFLESSKFRASLGKRVVGLRVATTHGNQLGLGRSLVRNVLKFVPWELGHLAAQQAFFSGDEGIAVWVYLPMALSLMIPLWWFTSLLLQGRAPYDSWTGARVMSSSV